MCKVRDNDVIVCIQNIVEKNKEKHHITEDVIMDGVFGILKNECVVLYYPLQNEKNKGFHITKIVNGEERDYVYINTAHPKEKQIFCAAHELGHIWKVDNQVEQQLGKIFDKQAREDIINRFAAELLMPEARFRKEIENKLVELDYDGQRITYANLYRLSVYLMDCFCVPFVALVRRLNEIGNLRSEIACELELKYEENPEMLKPYIFEGQYTRVNSINELKAINEIQDLVEEAEKKEVISENALMKIKETFELLNIPDDDGECIEYEETNG